MGELFGTAFSEFLPNDHNNKNEFFKIGYNLGKWIYVVDAFDDLAEDKKANSFNPILYMQDYESLNNESSDIIDPELSIGSDTKSSKKVVKRVRKKVRKNSSR